MEKLKFLSEQREQELSRLRLAPVTHLLTSTTQNVFYQHLQLKIKKTEDCDSLVSKAASSKAFQRRANPYSHYSAPLPDPHQQPPLEPGPARLVPQRGR